ncbi:MAG: ribonuclease Z [Methanomicrobiales archaeon]|nr:ribonuclease Z [Methanomicrobiales archaeon]
MAGETLQVYFLGTAGAMPTTNRNPSCIMVRRGPDTLLFDCGEGAQQQMMRAKTGFLVQGIFITHWHADHFLGIFGLTQSLSFMGRTDPLTIYGPDGCHEFVQHLRQLFRYQVRFPLQSVRMEPNDAIRFNGYEVRAIPTRHGTPSIGYVFDEDPRAGRFNRDRAIELGVPAGPLFGKLQQGETVRITQNNSVVEIHPEDVMGPPRTGRRIVYSGDTRPMAQEWGKMACEADLLIHDSTFDDQERERAREVFHSTAGEAGEVAQALGAGSLALVHISSRYTNTTSHVKDAKKFFAGTVTAPPDLMMQDILFRD